jgi:hypothetical protein
MSGSAHGQTQAIEEPGSALVFRAGPEPGDRRVLRYPGFDAAAQHGHWDGITTAMVLDRRSAPREFRFFTSTERQVLVPLCDRLLDLRDDARIPIATMIDARLADGQTEGWRYADMPEDGRAWRGSLERLHSDAHDRFGLDFPVCPEDGQNELIESVRLVGDGNWHGMVGGHVWRLWMGYACAAFYAYPDVWNEIGFPGPAYPRGYKNMGVNRREPFEVPDQGIA